MYLVLVLRPLTLWHPTLVRVLHPSMCVEGAGRCRKLSIGTEAWRDREGVRGAQPGPVGLGVSGGTALLKKSWALAGGVVQEE